MHSFQAQPYVLIFVLINVSRFTHQMSNICMLKNNDYFWGVSKKYVKYLTFYFPRDKVRRLGVLNNDEQYFMSPFKKKKKPYDI